MRVGPGPDEGLSPSNEGAVPLAVTSSFFIESGWDARALELVRHGATLFRMRHPCASRPGPMAKRAPPEQAHEETDRRNDDEIDDAQENGRGHFRDQERQAHPGLVDRPELPWNHG